MNRLASILCVLLGISFGHSYNVLVFFPYPGKSHSILGEGYVRHLTKAGHNVTYTTAIPIKNPPPNLRQIDVSSLFEEFNLMEILNIQDIMEKKVELNDIMPIHAIMQGLSSGAVLHENVQKLLMDPTETFDVAIVEWLYSELYSGVPAALGCPYIWSSSMEPHSAVTGLIDDVLNPAVAPDHMSSVTPPLSFVQRAEELWTLIKLSSIKWMLHSGDQNAWEKAYGPVFAKKGLPLPSMDEVKYNASLMLGNSHVSLGIPVRLPPNYVNIGGYHIDEDVKPMPEEFKKIMENAPHGVIFFSLGSMMPAKTMPEEFKTGFLEIFRKLKQTVIWKLETPLPNLPENVHIVQWAPQQSILAHPNTVLFITHGGLLSITETLHFGVPIIGIPLFADQAINVKRAASKGFAKEVKLNWDTPANLKIAIEEVLTDQSYRDKARFLSSVYHDRTVSPGQELVHWVEHVVKTKGAPHLRSPAHMLAWYQRAYLDLVATILIVLYIFVKLVKYVFKKGTKVSKVKKH